MNTRFIQAKEPPCTHVPILIYHRIADVPDDLLAVTPEKFKQQMKYLKDTGHRTMSLEQLLWFYYFGAELPEKPVILTFDDGYISHYNEAFEVLRLNNFTGTFFIIVNNLGSADGSYMSWEHVRILKRYGMSIGSHTLSHTNLRDMPLEQQIKEMYYSKTLLERRIGSQLEIIAYPYGQYDNYSLIAARRSGYKVAVSGIPGKVELGDDLFTLKRNSVLGGLGLKEFANLVK